ncbi:hypothetical protein M422DRAFT_259343 [Sphaerobolus stellatus SS14]|uniref:Uncharacterized protein n=1 Tax=Sphaerobolus stellatus (strain SS14) TaxID=990650 RepID=A0A0C9USZ1_SPHS4|nr:hypothetical protein M422DRAFT_259343 [Sphaerobolus stellatus SS14]
MEENGSKIIGTVMKNCKKVEVLERIQPDVNMVKRVVKNISNLKRIILRVNNNPFVHFPLPTFVRKNPLTLPSSQKTLSLLSPLKSLSARDVIQDPPYNPGNLVVIHPYDILNSLPAVKAARQVLKGPEEKRRLEVIYMWTEEPRPDVLLKRGINDVG